jgi:DNA polymerase-3 subunit alpha
VHGFILSGHPLELYRTQLDRFATATVSELRSLLAAGGESAVVGGLVTALRAIPIKKEGKNQGRKMAVFNLEDATGSVRVVVFPDTYDRFHHVLEEERAVLVKATLRGDGDHVELAADELSELDTVESTRAAALRVELDLERVTEEFVSELRDLLLSHPGPLPVRLELVRRGAFRARLVPPPALTVSPSAELREGLAAVLGGRGYDFEFAAQAAAAEASTDFGDERAGWVN